LCHGFAAVFLPIGPLGLHPHACGEYQHPSRLLSP
jgi:hypothetical protein